MNPLEETEKVFRAFGVSMAEVKAKLIAADYAEYVQRVTGPEWEDRKALSHLLFFAMAALLLKDVRNVLEIGSARGTGTRRLSNIFPEATVYTVDMERTDPDWKRHGWRGRHQSQIRSFERNIDKDNIMFVERNSFFLPGLDLPEKFDFIFVDGDHAYPVVASDFSYSYHRIRPGGFLFMDNYEITPKKVMDVTHMVEWLRPRIKEEILLLPLYLSPPSFVELQRMAFLVKE